MNGESPIILLSGMGADARVFAKQMEAMPQMRVPGWIAPQRHESLAAYGARLAEKVDPGQPCFVGGASFGGFVALEMIEHLDAIACILIGSVRSPDEFPGKFKALRKLSRAADILPFEVAALLSKAALWSGGSLSGSHLSELMQQMSDSDASFLRWACRAALQWEGTPRTGNTPIYQIHGEKDFVLPVKNTTPNTVVAGAGHTLSMSHPDEVTQFLKESIIESTTNKRHRGQTDFSR